MPQSSKTKNEPINIDSLNEKVLSAMRASKRANMGSENSQVNLMISCENEISRCKNLDEIRRNLESRNNNNRHTEPTKRLKEESKLEQDTYTTGGDPNMYNTESTEQSPVKFQLDQSPNDKHQFSNFNTVSDIAKKEDSSA